MASSAKKRLRNLVDQIPDDIVTINLLEGLASDQNPWVDHVIALAAATYVEKALEIGLKFRFIPLNKEQTSALFDYEKHGPLAEFSSRIKLAFALDVIGPITRDDLDHIRLIRNSFAHSMNPISFEMEEISEICSQLSTHKSTGLLSRFAFGESARAQYVNTTVTIATRLKGGLRDFIAMSFGRAFPMRLLP
jgi:hypothetical protein